jgi:type VI secretion system protein ImpC
MSYEFRFGSLGSAPPRAAKGSEVFRLAVLGDFSARANRGEVEVGAALAARKPLRVDVDDLDDMLRRLNVQLQLDIGGEEGVVEVGIQSMDHFHPDELYDNLEIFSDLAGLRQRLKNSSTFAKAAKEVQGWPGVGAPAKRRRKRRSRGSAVAADCKLSDFAQLVERDYTERAETSIDQLVKQLVAPYIVPAPDPRQETLVAAVDAAISDTMRRVLHHPDFQTTEALWRSLELLVRRLETGTNLRIVLYNITAEELAADLSSTESLEETGLYQLLVDQPALDASQGPLSAIVGNYQFEQTPPHAELLGRIAKISAAAKAPFIASIGTACLEKQRDRDLNALIAESWSALKQLPETEYLALTVPRFLLRLPYGKKTSPIDRFEFEEFTPQYGLSGMLWGNSAILMGLLLGQTFSRQGMKKMNILTSLTVDDMPFYFYTDADGDQVALPSTERLINVRTATEVAAQGIVPVLAIRGRAEVRLAGMGSVAGSPLAGPWPMPEGVKPPPAPAPRPAKEESSESSGDDDDDDLSSMLDDTDSSDDSSSSSDDDDLDSLLSSFGDSDDTPEEEASGDDDIDPELAALLAGL